MSASTEKRPSLNVPRWQAPGLCLVLAAITFAVFGRAAGFDFINLDDDLYVYENAQVAGGLSLKGLAWVFTHADCHFYHPLTMLSLMVDYQLHGLHAGGYHLTNVLLHTASVILLFLVLRQMTGALWRSAFVAAVFAIHPLRVESVAWVAERKDVLGTFFFMLTLGAYARYVRQPNSLARYLMVAAAFVLALLSKPTMVTLPFVLLLLDYWPLHRFEDPGTVHAPEYFEIPRRLILEKIPLLALAAGACAVTVVAEGKEAIATLAEVSMSARIGNALVSYVLYLRQMIWPEGLAVFYPLPERGYALWTMALSFLMLVLITGGVLAFGRKRPWLSTGWLWYLGMMTPMIGIVQVGKFAHADRMTYLPQIGIYLAVTWLAAEWGAKWRVGCAAIGALMAAVLGVLIICAWQQTAYWKNNETLWRHALDCTTGNSIAHLNLGSDFLEKGRADEAITQFQEALQIRPAFAYARLDLGNALFQKGRRDEAIVEFQQALHINPAFTEAENNLGNALSHMGRRGEAISHFQKALLISPNDADTHNNFGDTLRQEGKLDEAISHFEQALHAKPNFAEAHYNFGIALRQKGELDEAIAQYQMALDINPAFAEARNNLGNALLQKGMADQAMIEYQKALQINSNYSDAHYNLGNILSQKGRTDEAIAHIQTALQIAPANPIMQNSLAWLLATSAKASLRNGPRAVELARQANALTDGTNPMILHTLAAALAEAGRFSEAKECVQKAIELARAAGRTEMVDRFKFELQRYEAGLPLHQ
jgi:protein O-mannosyl-transferase